MAISQNDSVGDAILPTPRYTAALAHTDDPVGLFVRYRQPDWSVLTSVDHLAAYGDTDFADQYIAAGIRLAAGPQERVTIAYRNTGQAESANNYDITNAYPLWNTAVVGYDSGELRYAWYDGISAVDGGASPDGTWANADTIGVFTRPDGGQTMVQGEIAAVMLISEQPTQAMADAWEAGDWPMTIPASKSSVLALYMFGESLGADADASLLFDYSGQGKHLAQVVSTTNRFIAHPNDQQFPSVFGDSAEFSFGASYTSMALPTNDGLVRLVQSGDSAFLWGFGDNVGGAPDIQFGGVDLTGGPLIRCCGGYSHIWARTLSGTGKVNATGLLAA